MLDTTPPPIRERFLDDGHPCRIEARTDGLVYRGAYDCEGCGHSEQSATTFSHPTAAILWARRACTHHAKETHEEPQEES